MDISIELPTDKNGLTGRECPECKKYFKVKFGTGLDTELCNCPYCDFQADYNDFITKDQKRYIESYLEKYTHEKILDPFFKNLKRDFESFNRGSSFIKIKIDSKPKKIRLSNYQEKDLETLIICDNCKLEFAVYGVFCRCPDCNELSSLHIFNKSISIVNKRIELSNEIEDTSIKEGLLIDALKNTVSSFDGLGKSLKPNNDFLLKPKNIFQNFELLLQRFEEYDINIANSFSKDDLNFLKLMFQVRHIYEHNFGEVDNDFVSKTGLYHLHGKMYPIKSNDLKKFSQLIKEFGNQVFNRLKNS